MLKMFFYPPNLKLRLAVVFIAAATAHGVWAQQTIIFSKPAGDVTEKADSFMASPSQLSGAAGAFNAPPPLFGGQPAGSFDVLPGFRMPNALSPDEAKHWQKVLETKKKWTLMTPEEILGVPTAEKILGIPDPKNSENLTPEERFLQRQNHRMSDTAAADRPNAALRSDDSQDNPFRSQAEQDGPFKHGDGVNNDSARYVNQFLGATPSSPFNSEPRADALWTSPFQPPPPAAKPDLAQAAAMERFRALMEPGSPPPSLPSPQRGSPFSPLDSNLQPLPPANPAGRSFTPLSSIANRPAGIAPLPNLTSPFVLQPAPNTAGQSQLPPWLLRSSQPAAGPPRRVF